MRQFDYKKDGLKLLVPEIIGLISKVHEYKGKYELYKTAKPETLDTLVEIAKYASTESSNRIENIYTSDSRMKEILREKSAPRNRNEEEIIGYKKVLDTIHENHNTIEISSNVILGLHEMLYFASKNDFAGKYKNKDNIIMATDSGGNKSVRFKPLPAAFTPSAVEQLCATFNQAIEEDKVDPLILIPLFILDFLCIHPFNDGNGRISRLLSLLLLYKAGYFAGKYISLEKAIEKTKLQYYDVLHSSGVYWLENLNDPKPFVQYFLGVLISVYKEFEDRVAMTKTKGTKKSDIIKTVFDKHIGKITKSQIMEACPDISKATAERALIALQKSGYIRKISGGKYSAYVKVQ